MSSSQSRLQRKSSTPTRDVGRGSPTAQSSTVPVNQVHLQLQSQRQSAAIEQAEQLAGWRLSVTNAPTSQLTRPQAVIYYREQWLLERGVHRFKRVCLPDLPNTSQVLPVSLPILSG